MSATRRTRDARLAFDALSIEGGLLQPDWLARIAQLQADNQTAADYRVPKGLQLRDEIGRFWRIAEALHRDFAAALAAKPSGAAAQVVAEQFVTGLLREAFGFSSLARVSPIDRGDRVYPLGHVALGGRVPVVIAAAASGLDTLTPSFGDGGRRRSAFGLAQECLNAVDEALWGVVCDGSSLRILRDNASMTRPAWIEADLARIFSEERYADFAALWLLLHESRFGSPGNPAADCALERWRTAGRDEGVRARDRLREGVEDALVAIGGGFLGHPSNGPLRDALASGALSRDGYYQQLLRLVYRFLFLLTAEERELLHSPGTSDEARALYSDGYSLRSLRERAARRSAHDRHSDLWEALRIVFRGVAIGEPRLGLPALGGLFDADACPHLDCARLENRALLAAIFRLAWLRDRSGLARVNWRDMGPEELGSVYESLLELVPQITDGGRSFSFASGGEARGNARKLTGSYYTPDSLVQVLLDSALEPVIARTIAEHAEDPVAALLALSIVDPACGSGHFLLAAARRLGAHVARLSAGGTPSAAEYRHALRQVVGRCIFGVDLNPLAVELCKVSLWMEAVEPGLPLSFLDAHIQEGNALLGTTPDLMAKGIPDVAFDPIEGDDKKTATMLKKRNKLAQAGQRVLGGVSAVDEAAVVQQAVVDVERSSDADVAALAQKKARWGAHLDSPSFRHQRLVADAWCAAFVWPKPKTEDGRPNPLADAAPTNDTWRQLRDGQGQPAALLGETTQELARQYRWFHWHLAFPQVFARGGFDVVLGNPPWDSLLFREEEFFSASRPDIADAATAAARKRLIAKLEDEDPPLFARYREEARAVAGANAFVRSGVTYPLCGVGRVNLYALFAEKARHIVGRAGQVGQILPSGIVSDDSTKLYFQSIVDGGHLVSFTDFENREGLFPSVDSRMKFGVLTLTGSPRPGAAARFLFFATRVAHLQDQERWFTLTAAEIALLNPATRTCPIFRSRRDAEITKAIYRRLPVLASAGWKADVRRLLNSADDSGQFVEGDGTGRLRLYEGKYFHHFDHRWATSTEDGDRELGLDEHRSANGFIRTRFYYPRAEVEARFASEWPHEWVVGLRKIARSTDERTLIASVLPSMAVSDSAKVLLTSSEIVELLPCLQATLSSFACDYVVRQKIGGANLSAYILLQIPVVGVAELSKVAPVVGCSWREFSVPRTLELTYTAWDLAAFALDVGYDGPPFVWDAERRKLLRAELDAGLFHLYGIVRDDVDYIMETFPIVRDKDIDAHGEYRTKRLILEIYDAMAAASASGRGYQTRLDPPPADPRVAHRIETRAQTRGG